GRAHVLLLEPRLVGRVQHAEVDVLPARRGVDLDRDRDQTERDGPGRDRACCHDLESPRGGRQSVQYPPFRMPDLRRYREKRDPDATPEPFGAETEARALPPGAARM